MKALVAKGNYKGVDGWVFTCANEEHIIRLFCHLDSMDGDLSVANVPF